MVESDVMWKLIESYHKMVDTAGEHDAICKQKECKGATHDLEHSFSKCCAPEGVRLRVFGQPEWS